MLNLKFQTISPYLMDKTRLTALSSGSNYGNTTIHDEHLLEKMNNFIENLNNEKIDLMLSKMRQRDFPDLSRARVSDNFNLSSDMLLKDTFRQHHGIEEAFRKFLPNMNDIRKISEPSTKYHLSMARGYERHILEMMGRLDAEALDRKVIKPVII